MNRSLRNKGRTLEVQGVEREGSFNRGLVEVMAPLEKNIKGWVTEIFFYIAGRSVMFGALSMVFHVIWPAKTMW